MREEPLGEEHSGELGIPRKWVKVASLFPSPQSRGIAIRGPSLKYLLWGPTFLASNVVHFCTRLGTPETQSENRSPVEVEMDAAV